MAAVQTKSSAWAVKWRSSNRLDGNRAHLIGSPQPPTVFLFTSRRRARDFVQEKYGYIADRKDLRGEPHGWKTPQVVRVDVTVKERS